MSNRNGKLEEHQECIDLLSSDEEKDDRKPAAKDQPVVLNIDDDDGKDTTDVRVRDDNAVNAAVDQSIVVIDESDHDSVDDTVYHDQDQVDNRVGKDMTVVVGVEECKNNVHYESDNSDYDLLHGPAVFRHGFCPTSTNDSSSLLPEQGRQQRSDCYSPNKKESADENELDVRKSPRTRKREEKQKEKLHKQKDKEERKRLREEERERIKFWKEEEKRLKKEDQEKEKAMKGAYAKQEITCLIESGLSKAEVGVQLRTSLVAEEYTVLVKDNTVPNSIRFTRRDIQHGGASSEVLLNNCDNVEHFGK